MNNPLAPLAKLPVPSTGSQTVPTPGTAGYLAYAITSSWWPDDPALWQDLAAHHRQLAQQLTAAADASDQTYGPFFHERLKGWTGDKLQTSLSRYVNGWRQNAAHHVDAATALDDAADYLRGLQGDLTEIIDTNEPAYDNALRRPFPDNSVANQILIKALNEADAASRHAADRISSGVRGKFGTPPVNPRNPDVVPPRDPNAVLPA